MKKYLVLGLFSLQTLAAVIDLQVGSSITIQPDTVTIISCSGGGGNSSPSILLNPGTYRPVSGNDPEIQISGIVYEGQSVKSFTVTGGNLGGYLPMECKFVGCSYGGWRITLLD